MMVDFFFFSSTMYQLAENNIVIHILNGMEMFVLDCQSFPPSKKTLGFMLSHMVYPIVVSSDLMGILIR